MTDIRHTKKVYNKHAEMYHKRISSKDNIWHKYIEKPAMISLFKDEIKGKSVLDLGCGSGPFVKKLFSLGAKKVKGIDLSEELIKIAIKENPKVDFVVGDAKKTPYKNEEFDLIVSSLMAHYFKDLKPLFKEVSRILKKNGIFVFSMHHPLMEVSGRLKVKIKGIKGDLLRPYFHNNKYTWTLNEKMKMIAYHHTFEMIINSLNDSGFVIERVLEPVAPEIVKKIRRSTYERTRKRPSILMVKARKMR
jgi:SAM-dependent methyltransferase